MTNLEKIQRMSVEELAKGEVVTIWRADNG